MCTLWYVDAELTSDRRLSDDAAFDVLEALSANAAQMSIHPASNRVGISLTVDAESAPVAAAAATALIERTIVGAEVVQIDAMTEQVRRDRNNRPSIPELVGFAEIAEMAEVSRQRARTIAQRSDFPAAVVETAAGPLRVKAAVEQWLSSWSRKPGRPAVTAQ